MQTSLKKGMIRSSTIIETLVALVVLMISFSAAMVIFLKILDAGTSDSKLNAKHEVGFLADSLLSEPVQESRELETNGLHFRLEYHLTASPGLFLMKITATDSLGHLLSEHTRLVVKQEAPAQ